MQNLVELMNAAAEYERVELEPSLDGFLQEQALLSEADKLTVEGRATLMTLHNAKGLEYDYVFIVGMEEGTFPHARSLDEQNLEEERRLFYVGITRARKALTLSYARIRSTYGEREYQMPSRFLSEVPEELKAGSVPGASRGAGSSRLGGWGSASSGFGGRRTGSSAAASGASTFAPGEKVRHAKFGVGEVVEASAGKVVIRFGAEQKTLVPEIAPLSKV